MTYASLLADMLNRRFGTQYQYGTTSGRKYDRVTQTPLVGGEPVSMSTSVHAFVDVSTGDVYKPEGWKRPAKGIRGNVATAEGLSDLESHLDAYGRYLYLS